MKCLEGDDAAFSTVFLDRHIARLFFLFIETVPPIYVYRDDATDRRIVSTDAANDTARTKVNMYTERSRKFVRKSINNYIACSSTNSTTCVQLKKEDIYKIEESNSRIYSSFCKLGSWCCMFQHFKSAHIDIRASQLTACYKTADENMLTLILDEQG